MKCPKCALGMLEETEVRLYATTEKGTVQADEPKTLTTDVCSLCKGIWFDKGELFEYLESGMTSLGGGSATEYPDIDAKAADCPHCAVGLVPRRVMKDLTVNLQCCPKCEGFWVDGNEINRLEKAYARPFFSFISRMLPKRFWSKGKPNEEGDLDD